jgi:hypothetical protein
MIDLETLDTKPSTTVLSIGAAFFDDKTFEIIDTFHAVLDLDSQFAKGRTVSSDTLNWWMLQDGDAKKAVFNADKQDTQMALVEFRAKCRDHKASFPWGHGSSFDVTIIESLMTHYDIKIPWFFWHVRDTRTLFDTIKIDMPKREGTHHNALDDAVYQAECVLAIWKQLGGKGLNYKTKAKGKAK